MKEIQRVAIIGLGAIGATYGKLLQDALPTRGLSIIMDEERQRRYSKEGLMVNGIPTAFQCASAASIGLCDLILVAVKYRQLAEAVEAIAPCVGPETRILSLLNGISTDEPLMKRYGKARVPYAITVGNDLQRLGNKVSYKNTGYIAFGYDGAVDESLYAIAVLLQRAQIPCEVTADIRHVQWRKYLINVTLNQFGAVLGATYGDLQKNSEMRILIRLVGEEVMTLAQACGVPLGEDDYTEFLNILAKLNPAGGTSMYQDMQAGRLTEVDIFAGEMMRLGQEKGIAVPYNTMLYHMVKALEEKKGNC